jgi:hypothetical protein
MHGRASVAVDHAEAFDVSNLLTASLKLIRGADDSPPPGGRRE